MILLKWSAIILFGLSAVFMGELRAADVSELLRDARFVKSLNDFRRGCRARIDEVSSNHTFHTSMYTLYTAGAASVDETIDAIDRTSAQCVKIFAAVDQAAPKLAPYKIKFNLDDLTSGYMNPDDVVRGFQAMHEPKTAKLFRDLADSCRLSLKEIQVRFRGRLNSTTFEVPASELHTEKFQDSLQRTAEQCRQTLPVLADLNRTVALTNGVAFKVEPSDFFDGDVTAENVKIWIAHFNSDPSQIKALRARMLESPQFVEYRKKNLTGDLSKMLIQVDFRNSWGVFTPGLFTKLITMLVGSQAIMAYMSGGMMQPSHENALAMIRAFNSIMNVRFSIRTADLPRVPDSI